MLSIVYQPYNRWQHAPLTLISRPHNTIEEEEFNAHFTISLKNSGILLQILPRMYVGRLSYHVREEDIHSFFFVRLCGVRCDADDAVYLLNGKDLCGERVIIEHARGPRTDRDGYGGGGGCNGTHSIAKMTASMMTAAFCQ
uniref:RRM domain-containing protein n=1 Tax=Salmo trutta TaxID=8032 RepID=A0A673VRG0_SALTR